MASNSHFLSPLRERIKVRVRTEITLIPHASLRAGLAFSIEGRRDKNDHKLSVVNYETGQ